MEKIKMNLDREPLSSERIQQYQDFNRLRNDYIQTRKAIWKSPWFWGTGGITSLLLLASTTLVLHEKKSAHEEKITLNAEVYSSSNQLVSGNILESQQVDEASSSSNNEIYVNRGQGQIEQLQAKLVSSDFIPDSDLFHFRIDALADEFPEVYPLVGKRLEVIPGQRMNNGWFSVEWEHISVKLTDDNRYTILFSRRDETKAVKVKVVYEGQELEKENQRLAAENKEIRNRIDALRASL